MTGEWVLAPVMLGAVVFVSGFGVLVFGGHVDETRADIACRVAPAVVAMVVGVAVAFA
jgi:hypothetical protein